MTNRVQIKKPHILVEESQMLKRIGLSVNILILLVLMASTWNLWTPFIYRVRVSIVVWNYELTFKNQTASKNLRMMSRALDNRLPPLESELEYAPRNTFRDEDGEGDIAESTMSSHVDLDFLQISL